MPIPNGVYNDAIVVAGITAKPNKQGKRLYGTDLMVHSPSILKNDDKPTIILKAGVYNEEIKSDIYENINKKASFLE